jgi:small-conductance mechanosensitive channel
MRNATQGLDAATLSRLGEWGAAWLRDRFLTADSALQLVVALGTLVVAILAARPLRAVVDKAFAAGGRDRPRRRTQLLLRSLAQPTLWIFFLWTATALLAHMEKPVELVRLCSNLLGVWIVIRVTSNLIADHFWSRTVAVIAWTVAALNVLNLVDAVAGFLDGLSIGVGGTTLSVLSLMKAAALAAALLWGAIALSTLFQQRIERSPRLTPSVQVLLSKTLRATLLTLAVIVALGSVGIDLTAFAVFSGAVGVGVGFGLQKIVSNLIAGIILLLDRSIKPGDVVEVGGTFGWVNSLGARYASIVTRDGTEHLIPNENLITEPVVNWSFSSSFIRRSVPIGVSYDSDLDLATCLILQSASEIPRIVKSPEATCLLTGFGDSSVDLELRFWINDPQNGISNIVDDVLRRVWRKFHEHGIAIPFPQRDLHLKSAPVLRVADAESTGKPE